MQAMLTAQGPLALHDRLAAVDPEAAAHIHPHNSRRVIRALEIFHQTGRTMSQWLAQQPPPPAYNLVMIGLTRPREVLYRAIDQRVDQMITDGLLEEVQGLLAAGYGRDLPAMQGLGYRQMTAYLAGESTWEEAVRLLKRDTRRFAKRQLTWFKRDQRIQWFSLDDYPGQERLAEAVILGIRRALGG